MNFRFATIVIRTIGQNKEMFQKRGVYFGQVWGVYYSYSTVPKIYGSKQPEYKGVDRGLTDNHKSLATCAITIVYPT